MFSIDRSLKKLLAKSKVSPHTLLSRERPYKLGEGQPTSKNRVCNIPLSFSFPKTDNTINKILHTTPIGDVRSKNLDRDKLLQRSNEFRNRKQQEYNEYVEQAKNARDTKQKAYIALKVARQQSAVDTQVQAQRRYEMQKLVENKEVAEIRTPQGMYPITFNEDQAKEFGREMDIAMTNIIVSDQAQQHLAKDLYGKEYLDLTPKERNKVRYLIRTHRA